MAVSNDKAIRKKQLLEEMSHLDRSERQKPAQAYKYRLFRSLHGYLKVMVFGTYLLISTTFGGGEGNAIKTLLRIANLQCDPINALILNSHSGNSHQLRGPTLRYCSRRSGLPQLPTGWRRLPCRARGKAIPSCVNQCTRRQGRVSIGSRGVCESDERVNQKGLQSAAIVFRAPRFAPKAIGIVRNRPPTEKQQACHSLVKQC